MSAHGGSRPGSGRKPGGANKIDQAAREAALSSGQSPLDYMLEVMRDTAEERAQRLDAAKAAAPYLHAKLSSVELSGGLEHRHENWLDELDGA
jgi:hypothetical protein